MMTSRDIQTFLGDEPFVLFRLPGEKHWELRLQKDGSLYTAPDFDLAGFYMHPFRNRDYPVAVIPLERSRIIRFPVEQILVPEPAGTEPTVRASLAAGEHIRAVARAVDMIREGELEKVVLSAWRDLDRTDWDAVATLLHLGAQYPESLIYYWHHPHTGDYMGATPEVLLIRQDAWGLTYSLAGTKTSGRPWTDKERDEQNLVTDYITRKLLALQLPLSKDGPYDHRQGHLTHLRTDIRFIFTRPEKDMHKILRSLHPTPAVAGMPKKRAIEIIGELEAHDRRYYTGFLGPVDPQTVHLYVHLRSMEILPGSLRLMAGGGITARSDPQAEWDEVQQKMNILAQHLIYRK